MFEGTIFITGCNTGIGLELVKQFVIKWSPKHVIAACRDPRSAEELQLLAAKHKNISLLQLDLLKEEDILATKYFVKNLVGEHGINLLFNNAGIAHKSTCLLQLKKEQMFEAYYMNVLLPFLKTAAEQTTKPIGINKAAIINQSSILGSIQENNTGGLYPYRSSKTALNAMTKCMSIDLKEFKILVIAMHPGWVKTKLGGNLAPMSTLDCASSITSVLIKLNENHNGCFLQYDGSFLPW